MREHEENQNTPCGRSKRITLGASSVRNGARERVEEEQQNKGRWVSEAEVCLGRQSLSLKFLVGFAGQFQPL